MPLVCRLAAMDGMSNAAFRSVCFEYGADGASTEMVQALALFFHGCSFPCGYLPWLARYLVGVSPKYRLNT